ncbi:hypothetical protein [Williamsia sterculiae]|nr:hypothetical protein [Williamsia sterculiae]
MNAPLPGSHLRPRGAGADMSPADVDPSAITTAVAELVEQVDALRGADSDELDLTSLSRQTELLEQAHAVLTEALEQIDRA